ncbi:MAG TPA: phosphotransferase, partial [Candidatus Paceibacterota bacterium]|nr:phosphotransferase [Candidatus Paceibacterota bacterium]
MPRNESFPVPKTTKTAPEGFPRNSLSPEIRKETLATFAAIKKDPESFIDKGGAGSIHRLPGGICMKIPLPHYERHQKEFKLKLGNLLPEEASFLKKVSGSMHHGVRAPRFLGLVTSEEFSAILMEELPAVNLQKIINGVEKLPKEFHFDAFFKAIEEYLEFLHRDMGIVHGDFDSRNVMVDRETGAPYVIDFGRSKILERLPE